jgi:LysR family transcriptional regulator, nitrogen assimilation regulatory protein
MLDLRKLRYFVAIVDSGSVSRAAMILHIAQPALSQQLAQLEHETGMKLLRRSVRGVAPTDAGRAVYRHAQTLLKLAAETAHVARGEGRVASGRVRIGLPSSIAMILAAPLLAALHTKHPGILVELYESPSTYLPAQLFDERVDLSVLVDRSPSPSLMIAPLVSESIYFVHERKTNPLASCKSVSMAQLAGIPMILTTRATTLRHLLDAAFQDVNVAPSVLAEASSIQTLLTVVAQGGIGTLIPFSALSWHPATRSLQHHIVEPRIERVASLAWSRTASMTESTECVKASIIDVMRALVHDRKWLGATLSQPEA